MSFTSHCPSCGATLRVLEKNAGLPIKCPACGKTHVAGMLASFLASQAAQPAAPPRRKAAPQVAVESVETHIAPITSSKATASLILGLLSFCLPGFFSVPAIILGVVGRRDIRRSTGRLTGMGLAVGGLMTGSVSLAILMLVGTLLISAKISSERLRIDHDSSVSNLRLIALGMQSYADHMGRLPPSASHDKSGAPLLSWRVLLLPELLQEDLYRQFHLDEPWDSPHNKALLPKMPRVYTPVRGSSKDPYTTFYQVFVGPGTAFESSEGEPLRDSFTKQQPNFPDGIDYTFLVVEGKNAVPWTKPEDLPFSPSGPLPGLGGEYDYGFHAAFVDGSVRFIHPYRDGQPGTAFGVVPHSIAFGEKEIRGAITRNGGEFVYFLD